MNPEFWMQLVGYVVSIGAAAAGIYSAIKADLVRATVKAEAAAVEAVKAHERLDEHIRDHLQGVCRG